MYGKSRKGTIVSTCLIALMIQKFTLGSADYLLQFFRGQEQFFAKRTHCLNAWNGPILSSVGEQIIKQPDSKSWS